MTNSWVWRDEPGECGACGVLIQSDHIVDGERVEACTLDHAQMVLRGEQVPDEKRARNWRVERMRLRMKAKERKG